MYTKDELEMLDIEAIREIADEDYPDKKIDGRIKDKKKLIEYFLEMQGGEPKAVTAKDEPCVESGCLDQSTFLRGKDIIEKTDRIWVQFPDGPGPDGSLPINCMINGFAVQIPRNMPVYVSRSILNVLADSKATIEQVEIAENGGYRRTSREVARYPYQLASDADIQKAEAEAAES